MANELSRTNAVKKKLETLCKELQKQNKTVLDQSKQVSAEEQEKRKELSDRFSETIKDVQDKIASHDEERQKQDQENTKLREQLQSFLNQYEVRDKHFEHQLHAKDLEVQLAEAKLKQSEELCNKAIERAELYRCRQSPHRCLCHVSAWCGASSSDRCDLCAASKPSSWRRGRVC